MKFISTVLTVTILSASIFAQHVPELINYQGKLTDDLGQPLATADYTLSFSIYDAPQGGTLKWGPQLFDGLSGPGHGLRVPVVQGHFNVVLGPIDVDNKGIAAAFTDPTRYFEL